jgi:hypothetical protein
MRLDDDGDNSSILVQITLEDGIPTVSEWHGFLDEE